jgi:hypothetical protein
MYYKHSAATRLTATTFRRVFLITLILIFMAAASTAQEQSHPTYEVYALSYGIYRNFPVSALLAARTKIGRSTCR